MKERLVNIFVFEDETHVHAVGWRFYEKSGTYEELGGPARKHGMGGLKSLEWG